jgi:hypothetical protein
MCLRKRVTHCKDGLPSLTSMMSPPRQLFTDDARDYTVNI